jgi:signal transduction histidine kinase
MIFFNDGRIFEQYSCPLVQDGEKVGRVWSFKDITEHQHAELELRKSERLYRIAYERAELFKDVFTHDMNNIFHNIKSSAELITLLKAKSENFDKLEDLFQIINGQIDRGVKLINNVYKLSKLEESEISLTSVNVYKVLDDSIEFAKKSAQGKQLEIQVEKKHEELFVEANEFLLDIFENILHNAIKYNQNPTIEIQITIDKVIYNSQNYIRMQFKDNGIGIPNNTKELIFQKGNKQDKHIRGLGIGLSLVKKILEIYDGKISVENRIKEDYSQGSNFIVEIPEAN